MSDIVTISKRSFYLYQLMLVVAIFIAVFYWLNNSREFTPIPIPTGGKDMQGLILDGKTVPISNKFKSFAKKEGYQIMMLTNADGEIKVVELGQGKEIEPCGLIVGTKITGNCDLRGQTTHKNEIKISRYTINPNCNSIQIGRYLITYHDGGDGYPQYAWPCHVSSQHN